MLISKHTFSPYAGVSFIAALVVARGLRILQDFAGPCRIECYILLTFDWAIRSLISSSIPSALTNLSTT